MRSRSCIRSERFTQTTAAAVTINIKSPRSQFCVASTRTAAKRRLIMTFEVFLYTQILLSIVLLSFFSSNATRFRKPMLYM